MTSKAHCLHERQGLVASIFGALLAERTKKKNRPMTVKQKELAEFLLLYSGIISGHTLADLCS
jgi:hypothetical protein